MSIRIATDGPGCWRLLRKHYPEAEYNQIAAAYEIAADHDGCNEGRIFRESGVTFNPRPCRFIQILIEQLKEQRLKIIIAAVLASSAHSEELMQKIHSSDLSQIKGVSELVADVFNSEKLEQDDVQIIRLTFQLDLIRHLHMSSYSYTERETEVAAHLKFSEKCSLTSTTSAALLQLRKLYSSAINRFYRLSGANDK